MLNEFRVWLNGTMMTSFRSFVLSAVGGIVLIGSSIVGWISVLDRSAEMAWKFNDPSIRASLQTSETSHQNTGREILTIVFTFLTAAIVTNAASQIGDRVTSKEHVEAKERGRLAGAAVAASLVTSERPAVVGKANNVNVNVEEPTNGSARDGEFEESRGGTSPLGTGGGTGRQDLGS